MKGLLATIKVTVKKAPLLLTVALAILRLAVATWRRIDAVIDCGFKIKYSKVVTPLLDEDTLRRKLIALDEITASTGKKTYYVIRRDCEGIGLYTYVALFLGHLAYAVGKGYVPVIDMQNFPSIYLEKSKLGKENAWEYYYNQPYGSDLNDVLRHQRHILGNKTRHPLTPYVRSLSDDKEARLWAVLYEKFVVLNDKTRAYVEAECRAVLKDGARVLGVLHRGTDYARGKPFRHPIQPALKVVLEKTKEVMKSWGCDQIYIATEEQRAVEAFEAAFPGKVLVNERMYYDGRDIDYSKDRISSVRFDRDNDAYLKGLEYLSSIMILARCNCLIGGMCAGTFAAVYINGGKYERRHFFDLGTYGVDD